MGVVLARNHNPRSRSSVPSPGGACAVSRALRLPLRPSPTRDRWGTGTDGATCRPCGSARHEARDSSPSGGWQTAACALCRTPLSSLYCNTRPLPADKRTSPPRTPKRGGPRPLPPEARAGCCLAPAPFRERRLQRAAVAPRLGRRRTAPPLSGRCPAAPFPEEPANTANGSADQCPPRPYSGAPKRTS